VSTRRHRDVLGCLLITLGSVIWGGVMVASWMPHFEPWLVLAAMPVTTLLGAWTAAMVLEDLDVQEAAIAGALASVLGLTLRQLDERSAPEPWMLGPLVAGVALPALAVWLARRVQRPRRRWRVLAAGLLACGVSVAALVLCISLRASTTWLVLSPMLAMTVSGGIAYLLIPDLTSGHIIGGHCLIIMVGWFGFAIVRDDGTVLSGLLLGGVYGLIVGGMSALLGFWGRAIAHKQDLPDPGEVAEARVVDRA